MAANLGAKLTGPRLLKAMEGVFEGPIINYPPNPITWLDIVEFAKSNPGEFVLSTTSDGGRVCQFSLGGSRVEITEDDWRVIVSGAIDRFRLLPPHHPPEEDETAELATLEILDQRLQVLIKKADEVARKARQLNYRLSGRKAAIGSRRPPQGAGFPSPSQPHRGAGPSAGYDIHADLLQQFQGTPAQPGAISRLSASAPFPNSPVAPSPSSIQGYRTPSQQHAASATQTNRASPVVPVDYAQRESSAEDASSAHRSMMIQAKIDRLQRGDLIAPPCDRCRRLIYRCVKHQTACGPCAKKHAKCTWKTATDEELAALKEEVMTYTPPDGYVNAEGERLPTILDLELGNLQRAGHEAQTLPPYLQRGEDAGPRPGPGQPEAIATERITYESAEQEGRMRDHQPQQPPPPRDVPGGSREHSLFGHKGFFAMAVAKTTEASTSERGGSVI